MGDLIKCQVCGKEVKSQGINLHLRQAHGIGVDNKQINCECADGGSWHLLHESDVLERRAIKDGYKEVCIKCQMLR